MKLSHGGARRPASFRGGGDGPAAPPPPDSTLFFFFSNLSPASLFFLLTHVACCAASLIIGFRISRFLFLLLLVNPNPAGHDTRLNSSDPVPDSGRRVVAGRHGILIRPWPHPDPDQVMTAHRILARVQDEQRLRYGVRNPRRVVAITPTHVRTFQALHVSGVMHSLMVIPYEVTWIVVEAGGVTEETAALVRGSGLDVVHVPFAETMPTEWEERHRVEARMRIHALRIIRDRKLDGIVVFMDDSNVHSTEMFDEIQSVKHAGVMAIGTLVHPGCGGASCPSDKEIREGAPVMPVQGPVCNAEGRLEGFHSLDRRPYAGAAAVYVGEQGVILPQAVKWASFVLDSRLLWSDGDRPDWVKDFGKLIKEADKVDSPLALFEDVAHIQPLGNCGMKTLLWWLRAEARPDSHFPPGWKIEAPLEMTVPAKRTPWPKAVHRKESGRPAGKKVDSSEKQ